mgnify:FL=1
MNLWSLSIRIEDKYKNLFSEYFEDFDGFMSASLFNQGNKSKKSSNILDAYFRSNENINLGEFHENKYWILEVVFDKELDLKKIKEKINILAENLNIIKYDYCVQSKSSKMKLNSILIKKIINKNWLEENRKSFPVINLGKYYIYGSHIQRSCPAFKIPIKVNASVAFGTGTHATTKCCLKDLTYLSRFYKPKVILDYGCGTGILGIASKKIFKKSNVFFVDIDKNAVKLTKENLKFNFINTNLVYQTNIFFYKKYIMKDKYDLVIANILYYPLFKLAPIFKNILKPGAKIILSGLLQNQIPYIINRFNKFGFNEQKKSKMNGWGSVIMKLNKGTIKGLNEFE